LCDIPFESLGEKGKSGILKDKESRKRFLEDESHRIRFALYKRIQYAKTLLVAQPDRMLVQYYFQTAIE
jgi:hypothetical protein